MVIKNCKNCEKEFKTYPYCIKKGQGMFCSSRCSSIKNSEKIKDIIKSRGYWVKPDIAKKNTKNLGTGMLGKTHSEATKLKMREIRLNNPIRATKELNCNWRGGVTPLSMSIRRLGEYKKWRSECMIRDGFLCQSCFDEDKHNLNVDHIKTFSKILFNNSIKSVDDAKSCKELWDIKNGRTLCAECHRKTPTWGYRAIKALNLK